jgi:hypothetical protein
VRSDPRVTPLRYPGSASSRSAEHRNHVWTYDFVFERTHDGRPLGMLTLVDEYTRECLAIDDERRLDSENVFDRLQPDSLRVAETPAGSPFVPSRPPLTMMAAKSSILPPSKSGHPRATGEPGAIHYSPARLAVQSNFPTVSA